MLALKTYYVAYVKPRYVKANGEKPQEYWQATWEGKFFLNPDAIWPIQVVRAKNKLQAIKIVKMQGMKRWRFRIEHYKSIKPHCLRKGE